MAQFGLASQVDSHFIISLGFMPHSSLKIKTRTGASQPHPEQMCCEVWSGAAMVTWQNVGLSELRLDVSPGDTDV